MSKKIKNNIVIYQSKNGAIELRGDIDKNTIWASQAEIVSLFGVDQSVVSRHIKNIFKDGEVDEKSNMQKMHIANSDKPVIIYSLDVVLAVGYRTNSGVAIQFRKWATEVLRKHITRGYTVNKKLIKGNYSEFKKAIENVKALLPNNKKLDNRGVLELVSVYADTWLSLDAYDKDKLSETGETKKSVSLKASELKEVLVNFKNSLVEKGEATDIFGRERLQDSIGGIIGNIMQSYGGKNLYPSIEEKAAHLLYFIVKNHPFIDGNKRNGAFSFVWFLRKTKLLKITLSPEALTALTLLIAESNPKDKDKMIKLVLQILRK